MFPKQSFEKMRRVPSRIKSQTLIGKWAALYLALWGSVAPALAQSGEDVPPLRPARPEIPPSYWEQHWVAIGAGSALAIVVLAFLLRLLLKPKPRVPVPIEVQTRDELEKLRSTTDSGRRLSRISQCLQKYFIAAYELPGAEYTTSDFSSLITTREEIGQGLAQDVSEFLRASDFVKFAGSKKAGVNDPVTRALELVEESERRRSELRQIAEAGQVGKA